GVAQGPVGHAVDRDVDRAGGEHGGEEYEGQHRDQVPAVQGGGHADQSQVAERDEQAQHEHVAVGEVDEADDPVDHRVAEGDEGEDGAPGDPVDRLLDQDLVPEQVCSKWGGAAPLLPHAPPAHSSCPWRPGQSVSDRSPYSRMVSNWNLQPIGVSAFITLKPDMVS